MAGYLGLSNGKERKVVTSNEITIPKKFSPKFMK
jgi:hypothetical protein